MAARAVSPTSCHPHSPITDTPFINQTEQRSFSLPSPYLDDSVSSADLSNYAEDGRYSIETYASTVESLDKPEPEPQVEVVDERYGAFFSNAVASTPRSFAQLFPSTRRLLIRHDDTARDGNMNLQIVTVVSDPGRRHREIIMFHLRMHDLHNRKFSLRRYSRDSGREVCHSLRKYQSSTADKLPTLHRPLSSAFSGLRPKSEAGSTTSNPLRRQDSGYRSGKDGEDHGREKRSLTEGDLKVKKSATNTIGLEFSNYAHVNVKRRGVQGSKHYDFEYWSTKYQWKRSVQKSGDSKEVSFHLYHASKSKSVAHIIPEPLGPLEACEEERKGGWVPLSSMWISDPSIFETMDDVADVIIASGLVALVDDSIKNRWHRKRSSQSISLTSSLMKSVDRLSPNKVIDKIFQRRGSIDSSPVSSIRKMFVRR